MMTAVDYNELDPGIRDVVRMLNENGIETCDSGDGETKAPGGCTIDVPHVFSSVEARGAVGLLMGYTRVHKMRSLLGDEWDVQLCYSPADGISIVEAYKGTEEHQEYMRSLVQ